MVARREAPAGKLDEISQAIGRVDAYVHEYRHGLNNIAQQINGMELASEKRHANLKVELTAQIDKGLDALRRDIIDVAARVAALEATHLRQEGAVSVWKWLGAHWPFAAVSAAILAAIAWANNRLGL